MRRTTTVSVGLLCLGAMAFAAAPARGAESDAAAPAVRVAMVSAVAEGEPQTFIGTVEAGWTVQVMARVAGTLEADAFKEGGRVEKGDLLFAIEDTAYRANLAIARAAAKQAHAEYAIAKKNHDRNVHLLAEHVVTQSAFDHTLHALELQEARYEEAQARIALAEQDLGYTRIHAAVAGRIGKRTHGEGNYITPESGVLATLVAYDPAYVEFPVSEVDFANYFKDHDTLEGVKLALVRANGAAYEGRIQLDMVDNRVDERTNTIMVRLACENADFRLVPGGYVQVLLSRRYEKPRPSVPLQAAMTDGHRHYVFVVGPDNVVARRDVVLGDTVHQRHVVLEGLADGERVVVGGMNKIAPGAAVTPVMDEAKD